MASSVTTPESLMVPSRNRGEIESWFRMANEIYSQVGVRFVFDEVRIGVGTDNDWELTPIQPVINSDGFKGYGLTDQTIRPHETYQSNDCGHGVSLL